ncbi:gamma-glutamylcyclotransferase family protein [Pirellulaceae bacterium SH449]
MNEPKAFFVYGTLKQKQLRGDMWPRKPTRVLPGLVRARLFDLGPYPAALRGESWLLGEIWQFHEDDLRETTRALDRIEGYRPGAANNEYDREVLPAYPIVSSGQESNIPCWIYLAPDERFLLGRREISPFRDLREILIEAQLSESSMEWPFDQPENEKVAFWPDPLARVPRSFSEE